MKLIEAMKQIQELQKKAEDLRQKVANYCVNMEHETPMYPDTKAKIEEWLQSHHDTIKEILRLRVATQRTNLATSVTIRIDGKDVTHSIAEWIHRRRDLAGIELQMYSGITDKQLREGMLKTSTGELIPAKIRRYYDPTTKDKMMELYRTEPSVIDRTLEVVNAVTDVIEQ